MISLFFQNFILKIHQDTNFSKFVLLRRPRNILLNDNVWVAITYEPKDIEGWNFFVYRQLYVVSEYAIITVVLHLHLRTKISILALWPIDTKVWATVYRNAGSANSCFGYRHNGTLSYNSILNSCWHQPQYWNHLAALSESLKLARYVIGGYTGRLIVFAVNYPLFFRFLENITYFKKWWKFDCGVLLFFAINCAVRRPTAQSA